MFYHRLKRENIRATPMLLNYITDLDIKGEYAVFYKTLQELL